jgi:uncharacterized RDD family membrane protein YckC
MKWFYADSGRQLGPVDEAGLEELARTGVVRGDTLVWHEGMTSWLPYGTVRGIPPIPNMPIATPGFCSECGRPFTPDQLVTVGNATVCATCKPVYLQRLREGGVVVGARRYAGFWIRFVARVIDSAILGVIALIIGLPLAMTASLTPSRIENPSLALFTGLGGMISLLQFAVQIGYEVYFVSTRGGTPGKLVLGLKIIRADGSPVPAGLAAGRYLAQILSAIILMIGYIMAAFDGQKRALHDRICETRVIHTR